MPVTRVAGIDCGSNSIRLLVADVDEVGRLTDVDRRMEAVRLGQQETVIAARADCGVNFRRERPLLAPALACRQREH